MGERVPISKKTRFEVFKRDSFTCQYCGKSAPDVVLEVDHIKPVAEGGTNDMLNLVTACFDCNRGKGKVQLSDDAAIKKQKKELDRLAERREQIEMMYEWQLSLSDQTEYELDKVSDLIDELSGHSPSEHGRETLRDLNNRFGFEVLLKATRTAFTQYKHNTLEECDTAFNKIGGICYNMTHKTCTQCKHIEGRSYYNNKVMCRLDMESGYAYWPNEAENCLDYTPRYGGGRNA